MWAVVTTVIACFQLVRIEKDLANPEVRAHPAARDLERSRRATKVLASAGFLLLAVTAAFGDVFQQWMFAGLVFGAIGDVMLLGHGGRAFLLGLIAFLIGHLAYVIGIAQMMAPIDWFGAAGLLVVPPIAVAAYMLRVLWPKLGSLRVPVSVYVGAIVAMVIGAIAIRDVVPKGTPLAIGAALFFASDLAVARDRFLARDFTNKLWGLPAYYAGQLLIAWAVR